jgi:hypothetical protein
MGKTQHEACKICKKSKAKCKSCNGCPSCPAQGCKSDRNHQTVGRSKKVKNTNELIQTPFIASPKFQRLSKKQAIVKQKDLNYADFIDGDAKNTSFEEKSNISSLVKFLGIEDLVGERYKGITGDSQRTKSRIKLILKTSIDKLIKYFCTNDDAEDIGREALVELFSPKSKSANKELKSLMDLLQNRKVEKNVKEIVLAIITQGKSLGELNEMITPTDDSELKFQIGRGRWKTSRRNYLAN